MGVHLHFRVRWAVILAVVIVLLSAVVPLLLERMLGREVSSRFSEAFYTLKATESFVFVAVGLSVFIYAALLSLAVAALTLYFSHHIAHPLHHLEKSVEALKRGDLRYTFHQHRWDQLKGLSGALDELRDSSVDQLRQVGRSMDRIEKGWARLDTCRPEEYDVQAEKQLALMEAELARARDLLAR